MLSQESQLLTIGELGLGAHGVVQIVNERKYRFPDSSQMVNENGKPIKFCTFEGIAWIDEHTLVAVSDKVSKEDYDKDEYETCNRTDEAIHLISIQ